MLTTIHFFFLSENFKLMKRNKFFKALLLLAGVFTFLTLGNYSQLNFIAANAQEFEDGGGGDKSEWYYHPCLYSFPNKECKLVKSDESCGKSKTRPGLPC